MARAFVSIDRASSPLVAVALHDGHALRPEVSERMAISPEERLREEDPFTRRWTSVAPTSFVAVRSRFEVDLNRPREGAVYLSPEQAWGLRVWASPPPPEVVERSLASWDTFYGELERVLAAREERFGSFLVLDLHSFNHRRGGPDAPPDDPATRPDFNLGTASMDRELWAGVVERFLAELSASGRLGWRPDARENVNFRGGELCAWVHRRFPGSGCAIAVEVKKFFMDEWTGRGDPQRIEAVGAMLGDAAPALLEALERSWART